MLRLIDATSGEVRFRGEDNWPRRGASLREMRREMQISSSGSVFVAEPPDATRQIVEEPLVIHHCSGGIAAPLPGASGSWSLGLVGLNPEHLERAIRTNSAAGSGSA